MSESATAREPAASCPLCGGRDRRVVVVGYDRMFARAGDYRYARCAGCGLIALEPLPHAAEVAQFYPDGYHQRLDACERNLEKRVNRLAIRYLYGVDSVTRPRWARAAIRAASGRILRGLIEPQGANRLLDVGCGTGATLAVYRRLGWRVRGIEPHPLASAACRRRELSVHPGTVFDAPFGREFDVVLLSHVIEHVGEPVAVVRRAGEFLAPGGRLIVTTPNARGIGFTLYRSCWFALDAPRHLFLFDPRTLSLLARAAGLAVRRLVTRATPQLLCESRHYAATQGQTLPPGLETRAAILQRAARRKRRYRLYRELMTPLTALTALAGRGDLVEAEFAADPP